MGGNIVLSGIVVKGQGEGSHYLSMEYYKQEIKKKVGFDVYPGTLNLKIDEKQLELLGNMAPININDHKSGNIKLFGAKCYKASIKNTNGAIIMPDLTKHKNVIEFIAPVHLKSELKIKDGDIVKIELK